jgi:hypothetical protein
MVTRTVRGNAAERLLDRQLVRGDPDDLAVTVDDEACVRGTCDFDGTYPRTAKRSECRERERRRGCIDGHGLPPEAIKTGASPA